MPGISVPRAFRARPDVNGMRVTSMAAMRMRCERQRSQYTLYLI